ncbi:MAG: DoxX family protein [Alphaproteobacteria bacterium]|nr:MAG: DoxX family protein [Alphaproteobacteria bacterium]
MADDLSKYDRMIGYVRQGIHYAERIPEAVIALLLRVGIAGVFWNSGLTKLAFGAGGAGDDPFTQFGRVLSFDWRISETTFFLFEHEYAVPLLPSHWMAYAGTTFELLCPVFLVLGLFTRLAVLPLLGMTIVIQTFVYPELWLTHAFWAGALLYLLARGAGALSLDTLLARRFLR